jgi:putative flippase GtrA
MGTAMTVTWLINRRFTFKTHGTVTDARGMAAEGGRYGLVAVIAALVNYGVYALTLWSMPMIVWAGRNLSPPMAAVVGSGVAMFVSYYGYSRFAFRHGPHRTARGA